LIGPENLGGVNNPVWHDQRTLLNKAFTTNSVFFEPISKKVESLISKWEKEPEAYVGHDLQKLTLDVLATSIFGLDFDTLNGQLAEPLNAYNYSIQRVANPIRFIFPWFNRLPLAGNIKLEKELVKFDKYCWEVMDQTKKKMEEDKKDGIINDKLSLIQLMYENGLSEQVIRDNVSLFFLAGHETTSATLTWIMAYLVSNPQVQEKARKEVFEIVLDELTFEHVKELPYLEGIIRETLRMRPAGPVISGRYSPKDSVLGPIKIPAGTGIQCDIISMCFDPAIWGDPEVFRPERWFAENVTKEQRGAWIPFSYGPRICIGMNFSLVEQKIFLVKLLKQFKEIKLAPGAEIKHKIGTFISAPDFDKLKIQFK